MDKKYIDKSIENLTKLIEKTPFPVYAANREGRICAINKNFLKMLDKNLNDLINQPSNVLYQTESLQKALNAHDSVISFKETSSQIETFKTGNGNRGKIDLRVVKSPWINEGSIIAIINTLFDLRMEADNIKLRNSKIISKDSKKIAQVVPSPIYWFDLNQHYLGVNSAVLSEIGKNFTEDKIIGKTPYDIFPWEMANKIVIHNRAVANQQKTVIKKEMIRDKQGDLQYYSATIAPFKNDMGNLVGTIGISINITELKQTQKELEKSKIEAEIASAAKSEFIANISHDLRVPMSGVVGMLEGLMAAIEEAETEIKSGRCSPEEYQSLFNDLLEKAREYTTVAKLASNQLINLFNEILETIRLESGKFEAEPIEFDLKSLIDKNVQLLQPVAKHKELSLSYTIDESVPLYLKGIAHCIDRSLANLLSNALKFTQEGLVEISASVLEAKKYRPGDKVTLQLKVRDTGIGIPEDKFEEIFQHFSRLTSSYHGVYKGAGLGLYAVKQYLKPLDGIIQVESKVNKGSCFTVLLPLEVVDPNKVRFKPEEKSFLEATIINQLPKKQSTQEKNKKEAGKIYVLVVEDQPVASMGIRVLLETFDCAVDIAKNGQMAVDKASQNDYDLIFMDVGLPDFEGTEVTRRIRSLPDKKRAHVTILALTGHASDPKKHQACLDVGMQEVLSKPLQKLVLEKTLARWVWQTIPEQESNQAAKQNLNSNEFDLNSLPFFDKEGTLALHGGDIELLKELIPMLKDRLKKTQQILPELYANKDRVALRYELHAILGNLAYFKVPRLNTLFLNFQAAVKAEPQDAQYLESTYQAIKHTLKEFFAAYDRGELKIE